MVRCREKQLKLDNKDSKRLRSNYQESRSRKKSKQEAADIQDSWQDSKQQEDGMDEADLERFLNKRQARGRGAIGSLKEIGPNVQEADNEALQVEDEKLLGKIGPVLLQLDESSKSRLKKKTKRDKGRDKKRKRNKKGGKE
eukprot:TRINITY_DN16789_c1_g1_i3.p3 TRINITY_DN16789_c1_g1~~TRINITY_DN16789_c1_g1_i3.p3  ORF type:complete len:141 (-),score=22.53 TRINITY_DN16789_c1_g1_i3:278-700(-)